MHRNLRFALRSESSVVPILFVLAWVIRVTVIFCHPQPDHYIMTDTHLYWESAVSMAKTGLPVTNDAPLGLSYVMVPFAGIGMSLWAYAHFIQPLFGAGTVAMAWVLGRRMGGRLTGAIAGLCCLINPTLINSSSQVVSEDLSALCTLSALALILRERNWLAGIMFGMANVVRSPSFGCFVLFLVVLHLTQHRWQSCFRPFLTGWAMVVAVASAHLSFTYERPIFLTAQIAELRTDRPLAAGGTVRLTPEEMEVRGGYLQFALGHPKQFVRERYAAFVAFIQTWADGEHRSDWTKLIMTLSEGPFMLGSLWLILTGRKPRSSSKFGSWALPSVWLGLCLFHTLTYGMTRYRVVGLPLLVIFISLALADFIRGRFLKYQSTGFGDPARDLALTEPPMLVPVLSEDTNPGFRS